MFPIKSSLFSRLCVSAEGSCAAADKEEKQQQWYGNSNGPKQNPADCAFFVFQDFHVDSFLGSTRIEIYVFQFSRAEIKQARLKFNTARSMPARKMNFCTRFGGECSKAENQIQKRDTKYSPG
jgi:hypothetical protein